MLKFKIKKMENTDIKTIEIVTDKNYFLEETINIFIKSDKKFWKPKYTDWIALYKCSSNRHLDEFVAVETNLIRSPTKHNLIPVTFYAAQLKNIYCNIEYEFLYGNKFNEICGISRPLRFIHKNDCFCYQKIPKTLTTKQCTDCVSQKVIDSLLARMTLVENQLSNDKMQTNEIMLMNQNLWNRLNKCESLIQKSNELLDDLFYTDEPVTNDGSRWVQSCSDTDLKMSLIANQECELQDLSNQNAGLKKVLEKVIDEKPSNMDTNISLESMVNVECGFIPEPLAATFVYIDTDEEDTV